jgi:hypothetical protein
MLRYAENYVEKGIEHYEEKFRLQRIKSLFGIFLVIFML